MQNCSNKSKLKYNIQFCKNSHDYLFIRSLFFYTAFHFEGHALTWFADVNLYVHCYCCSEVTKGYLYKIFIILKKTEIKNRIKTRFQYKNRVNCEFRDP